MMWPSASSGAAVVRALRVCMEPKPSPPLLRPPGVDVGIKVICHSSLMLDLHLPFLHVYAGWLSALHCSVNPV